MIVVSNSSPLISLARVGLLELLPRLFDRIHVAQEVYQEVVVSGAGRPAAGAVAAANQKPVGGGAGATLTLATSLCCLVVQKLQPPGRLNNKATKRQRALAAPSTPLPLRHFAAWLFKSLNRPEG